MRKIIFIAALAATALIAAPAYAGHDSGQPRPGGTIGDAIKCFLHPATCPAH